MGTRCDAETENMFAAAEQEFLVERSNFQAPRGDQWQCSACGNVNFADRTNCNRKGCLRPRDLPEEAGMHGVDLPEETAMQGVGNFQVMRDGQWLCPHCQNINFADRLVCNKQECRAPRPDVA